MEQKISPPQEAKLHFLDYWRIIRIRKTVILAVFLLVVVTATVVTVILPEYYSSVARIRIERDQPNVSPVGNQNGINGAYDPHFILTEFEVIRSEVVLSKVVKNLDLNKRWGQKLNGGVDLKTADTIDIIKKYMDLRPARNTSIIEIRVLSDNRDEAAELANAVAEAYKQYRLELNRDTTSRGILALEERLREKQAELRVAASNLDNLRIELKVADPSPQDFSPTPTLSMEAVRQILAAASALETDQIRMETQLTNLINLKKLDPRKLRATIQTAAGTDNELAALIAQLNDAESALITLSKDYSPEHPNYTATKNLVDSLERRVDERVDGILLGLENRVDAGRRALEGLQENLQRARSADIEIAEQQRPYYEAKRRVAEVQQFVTILTMKVAAEQTDLELPRDMVTITDPAHPGMRPVRPNKLLNIVLGIVIGLVVGVGLAFFIEYLDTSVKTIDDVERTLGAPVLGVIPQNVGFLIEEGAESPHAEAYRVLRTNLLFSRKDERLNSIAIVSAGAGEGKSTTVFNLATVFAQNGSRVVIVDSDLRRPTLHKMLRVTNSLGLTNYLLKQNTLEEVIQRSSLPTLDFMASGRLPSSSMGILSSAQMRALITDLKARYDFVFFDSPPIMGVSDASILASEVDITLQVIQYRRYPQPMNIRAKQMIEKVGSNLLGIVLNNINMSQDESYYYYSGYYHEYYSKNEEAAEGDEKSKVEIKQKY